MRQIEQYLEELDHQLIVGQRTRSAILREIRDHLLESSDRIEETGSSRYEAVAHAISSFGTSRAMARQFNAEAGARAMREAPFISLGAGVSVVGAFLVAALNQPHTTSHASLGTQMTFFAGVIFMQVAIVAGLCAAVRAIAIWRSAASSGNNRLLVRRSSVISMNALLVASLFMAANFTLVILQSVNVNETSLICGSLVMVVAAALGLYATFNLRVNGSDEDPSAAIFHPPILFALGDRVLDLVRRYPVVSVVLATAAAFPWALGRAEETSLIASLPWGIAEAFSVIIGFLILGPALGLRSRAIPLGKEHFR